MAPQPGVAPYRELAATLAATGERVWSTHSAQANTGNEVAQIVATAAGAEGPVLVLVDCANVGKSISDGPPISGKRLTAQLESLSTWSAAVAKELVGDVPKATIAPCRDLAFPIIKSSEIHARSSKGKGWSAFRDPIIPMADATLGIGDTGSIADWAFTTAGDGNTKAQCVFWAWRSFLEGPAIESCVVVVISSDASFAPTYDVMGTVLWLRNDGQGGFELLKYEGERGISQFVKGTLPRTVYGTDVIPVCEWSRDEILLSPGVGNDGVEVLILKARDFSREIQKAALTVTGHGDSRAAAGRAAATLRHTLARLKAVPTDEEVAQEVSTLFGGRIAAEVISDHVSVESFAQVCGIALENLGFLKLPLPVYPSALQVILGRLDEHAGRVWKITDTSGAPKPDNLGFLTPDYLRITDVVEITLGAQRYHVSALPAEATDEEVTSFSFSEPTLPGLCDRYVRQRQKGGYASSGSLDFRRHISAEEGKAVFEKICILVSAKVLEELKRGSSESSIPTVHETALRRIASRADHELLLGIFETALDQCKPKLEDLATSVVRD